MEVKGQSNQRVKLAKARWCGWNMQRLQGWRGRDACRKGDGVEFTPVECESSGNGGVKDDHPGFWLGWLLDSKNKKMSCMYQFWERSLWENYWEIGTRYWVDQCGIQERSDWWEGWCTVSLHMVPEAKVMGEVPPGEPRDWEKVGSHAQNLQGH